MEGIPVAPVTKVPLFAVVKADITLVADAYKRVLTAFVVGYVLVVAVQFVPSALKIVPVPVATLGYVAVEKLGAAAVLACKTWPVVPPANMEGTPVLLVTSKPLFPVAKADITLAAEA